MCADVCVGIRDRDAYVCTGWRRGCISKNRRASYSLGYRLTVIDPPHRTRNVLSIAVRDIADIMSYRLHKFLFIISIIFIAEK